jgi:hypothetical protein
LAPLRRGGKTSPRRVDHDVRAARVNVRRCIEWAPGSAPPGWPARFAHRPTAVAARGERSSRSPNSPEGQHNERMERKYVARAGPAARRSRRRPRTSSPARLSWVCERPLPQAAGTAGASTSDGMANSPPAVNRSDSRGRPCRQTPSSSSSSWLSCSVEAASTGHGVGDRICGTPPSAPLLSLRRPRCPAHAKAWGARGSACWRDASSERTGTKGHKGPGEAG